MRQLKQRVIEQLEYAYMHQRATDRWITISVDGMTVPVDLLMSPEQIVNLLPPCCFVAEDVVTEGSDKSAARQRVFAAIEAERNHQDAKYGADKEQSLPGFLVVIRKELEEAELGWVKNLSGRNSALSEICQIAAVCVAAMEKYGTTGSAIATNDRVMD